MSWSVMSDVPNPIVDANGDVYSGAVLKAYLPGTTTSTSIAIDSAGSSPQTSITANAEGKWEVSGNEILPYIDRKHKWAIFADATDATANTPAYMGFFDNVDKTAGSIQVVKKFDTLALAVADTGIIDGDALKIAERTSGNGGGATWDVVLSSTVTENTYDIVQCTGVGTLSLVLRIGVIADIKQFGAVGDGVADDTGARDAWLTGLGSGVFESTIVGPREGFMPAGKYKFTDTMTVPTNSTIKGVFKQSVILPTIAASTAVIQATGSTLDQIVILGTNATGASIGLDIGATGLTSNTFTRKVMISGFAGTNAVGLDLSNAVTCNFDRVLADDNYHGAHIFKSGSTTLPSNCDFKACEFKSNDQIGAWIEGGSNITFSTSCNFELNGEEGIYAKSGTGAEISNMIFNSAWVEANMQNYTSGATRNAEYQVFLRGRSIRLNDAHFFGNSNEAKAMHLESSIDFVIDHCEVPNQNGIILVDLTSSGNFVNWPVNNGTYTSLVTDSSTGQANLLDTKFGTYTPGLTFATAGDLSVAFSTQKAYWTQTGQTVSLNFFMITSSFTHTTASGNLTIDLGPFTSANKTDFLAVGSLGFGGITKASYTQVQTRVLGNSTDIDFIASGSGVAAATITASDMPTGGSVVLEGSITFEATNA